jgi:hypothetical protein
MPPFRQVRASFDDETITVYQAYSPAIAIPAARNNSYTGTPFSLGRMTWIKPSFLWMMYRCGWATKDGQEQVLALRMTCVGFEHALSTACLSHFDADVYADHTAWEARRDATANRVQWDPERDLALRPLAWRSLQLGLSGDASRSLANEWTLAIDDITPLVHEIRDDVEAGRTEAALAKLPTELPYPLPADVAAVVGADA